MDERKRAFVGLLASIGGLVVADSLEEPAEIQDL